MIDEIEILEEQSREREQSIQQAEQELLDRLQNDGLIEVWNKVKTGLHCEKFLASRTGKAVVDRLARNIIDAQTEWLNAADPCAPQVLEAHRRAQAAHMALFCFDELLGDGKEAQVHLDRIAQEIGDE